MKRYNEFKKTTQISKVKRKIAKEISFCIFIIVILGILTLVFKKYLIFIVINAIVLLFYFYRIHKIKKITFKNIYDFYDELHILLQKEKYKKLRSLSKLDEFSKFLIQKQSTLLFHQNQKDSKFILVCYFLINTVVGYFITEFLSASQNWATLFKLLVIIIIIIALLFTCYIFFDLIHLLTNQDDDLYIDLLLNLIREEKIKILDSKDKTIVHKLKYILKLGIYS